MSTDSVAPSSPTDEQKPFFYGWWIVAELSIAETIAYGVLAYAFSVFMVPMETELGWTRAEISAGQSLALMMSGIAGIGVGWWLDRHGARLLMTVGAVLATGLVFAWAHVQDLLAFYAIWFGIGITMAMLFYEPAFTVIANWFTRKRGRALAWVTFVAGFASTIFLPLANWLNELYGWRGAVMLLGILLGVTLIPMHALVLRRRPEDLGLLPDGVPFADAMQQQPPPRTGLDVQTALRKPSFWVLTVCFGAAAFSSIALRFHFFPYLLESGYDASFAAFLTGLIGAMQVLGRVIFAPLESRVSTRTVTAGIFALVVLAFVVLIAMPTRTGTLLFVALFGASFGAMTLAQPALLADTYGTLHYGRISSIMNLFRISSMTVAPFGAGALYTLWGSYDRVWWVLLIFPVIAFTLIWLLPADQTAQE